MYFRHIDDNEGTAARASGAAAELTRRQFLKLTTLAGSGLTLGFALPGCGRGPLGGAGVAGATSRPLAIPFVRIAPDNTVTVICKHLEAGQGVWTGLPAIVAEELDASWEQMRIESAPAEVPRYGNLAFGGKIQGTGGSTSVANSWEQLRHAGATARAMLVAAAAQEWRVPPGEIIVSEGVVSHTTAGRQATLGDLADAAARQAVPANVKLKNPAGFRIVGREKLPRLDSRAKSTGKQQFAIDVVLPGMMTAVVMRPPRFGAKASSFDATKAKAVAGVVDVVQIPRGVAVVGRDMWSARKGREALSVTWDESAAEKRGTTELMKEYRALGHGKQAFTVARRGDVDAVLAHADAQRVEGEFQFPYLAHAPMEPLTAVCRLSPDKCEVWAGCQFQTIDQGNAAAAAGLKPEQVFINTLAAGGTFGRRANAESDYIAEVVSIAKATGGRYPVRLIWTREDDITGGRYRPLNYHRITAAVGRDGRVAYRQRVVGQSILAGTPFTGMIKDGVDPTSVEGNAAEEYDLEHVDISWTQPTVGVPVLWWRSVGHTHMAFSKEVMIDELAQAAGQDPVAFRLALLTKHPRHLGALRLAAEKAGWDQPFPKGNGRGRGVAVHESFDSVVAQVAEVTVSGDKISVDRVVCAVDCGIAVTPDVVKAQMQSGIGYGLSAALYGAITLTDGRVDQSNFDKYRVLRINEMPRVIEVYIVPSANAPTGVGEPGTPPIAPAVANAVRAATGIRLRTLPFDLAAARATGHA
jgi:isoquinoline 1-oxidoreductase beta subunit